MVLLQEVEDLSLAFFHLLHTPISIRKAMKLLLGQLPLQLNQLLQQMTLIIPSGNESASTEENTHESSPLGQTVSSILISDVR